MDCFRSNNGHLLDHLPDEVELQEYFGIHRIDLFKAYRTTGMLVINVRAPDAFVPPLNKGQLAKIRKALAESPSAWPIHCSAGIYRTGCAIGFL